MDKHHVWFNRADYRTPLERGLRKHRGFVLTIDMLAHRDLHAETRSPEKPNHHQALHLINTLGEFQQGRGGLYILHHTIEQFHIWEHSNNQHLAANAPEIAENLEVQSHYFTYPSPIILRRVS